MKKLLQRIKSCKICEPHLPMGANPVFTADLKSQVVIVGQAPGRVVHETGVPWNDKSGDNLRNWLGVDSSTFYDTERFALMPMGFCYPGTGLSGDLPPRKECAPEWHDLLWSQMNEAKITLLIGQYAQKYYLQKTGKKTLTQTVRNFEEYLPKYFVLPHPSPRNNIWKAKNPWFEEEVLPVLKAVVQPLI